MWSNKKNFNFLKENFNKDNAIRFFKNYYNKQAFEDLLIKNKFSFLHYKWEQITILLNWNEDHLIKSEIKKSIKIMELNTTSFISWISDVFIWNKQISESTTKKYHFERIV